MYHFVMSGLNNVFLLNGYDQSEGEISFLNINDLQFQITKFFLTQTKRLTWREIRFIKGVHGWFTSDYVRFVHMDRDRYLAISRSDNFVIEPVDLLTRYRLSEMTGIQADIPVILDENAIVIECEFVNDVWCVRQKY